MSVNIGKQLSQDIKQLSSYTASDSVIKMLVKTFLIVLVVSMLKKEIRVKDMR